MTKYFKIATFGLPLILVFFTTCKKIPFDWRNKYCGTWSFTNSYKSNNPDSSNIQSTTSTYKGKVYYDKKDKTKKTLIIQFTPDLRHTFTFDQEGNLNSCEGGGQFNNSNTVEFVYYTSDCHAPFGTGARYVVTGTK